VTVLRDDLIRVFKKTGVFLNKFRQVTITVTNDHLTVSAQNADVGQVTDTVPATVEGDELTLSFNQQYLLDPLAIIQDDSVRLSFAGVGRALIISGISDTSARYLVMPMNK
jgi:DNA polymerase-3 subunit beta